MLAQASHPAVTLARTKFELIRGTMSSLGDARVCEVARSLTAGQGPVPSTSSSGTAAVRPASNTISLTPTRPRPVPGDVKWSKFFEEDLNLFSLSKPNIRRHSVGAFLSNQANARAVATPTPGCSLPAPTSAPGTTDMDDTCLASRVPALKKSRTLSTSTSTSACSPATSNIGCAVAVAKASAAALAPTTASRHHLHRGGTDGSTKRPLLASTLASGRACDNGQPRALKRTFTDIDEPSAIALPKTGYSFLQEYYFMCRATSLSSATTTKTASVSYVRCMEVQIRPLWLHSMEYVSVHDFCAKCMMRCTKCGARLRARYAVKATSLSRMSRAGNARHTAMFDRLSDLLSK